MDSYTLSAIEQSKVINKAYNRTKTYVEAEISKILKHTGGEDTLAYEYRMKRLNALLKNTEEKMKELYGINVSDTTAFLKSIIPEAYYHTIFDIAQGVGEQPVFAAVNDKLINAIVKEPWSGENYSKRIWKNTNKLADDVREVLTEAAMSGESIYKTSRKLSDAFDTSAYNSRRLIRTETTYACNQAEMASYEALDIDKYRFVATLDTRTSPICQKLDGEVFDTKDAQAGKNLPAMHPNCRSTTIPYFEEGMPEERIARDKDGKRIKVPADMKYDEWYKQYINPEGPPKPNKGNTPPPAQKPPKKQSEKPQAKPEQPKPVDVEIPPPEQKKPEYVDTPIPEKPVEVPKPEARPAENKEQATEQTRKAVDDAYEYHRKRNKLNLTPVDQLDTEKVMPVNYGNLSDETAIDISNVLVKLMSEYDTPLNVVRVMTKEEYVTLNNSFAAVTHDYSMNSATMVINPVKMKEQEKLINKLKNHRQNGFIVDVADDRLKEYVTTHEFAHSLLGMTDKLSKRTNWAQTDYAKIKKAREEIQNLYNDYLEELRPLQEEFDRLTEEYFTTLDESVAEKLSSVEDKLNAIKISEYSLENADEFMAEAFTQSKIGSNKTKYSDKVTKVIDSYFRR